MPDLPIRDAAAGDIENRPDYNAKDLRAGMNQRGDAAFQSLAIHSCMSEQLGLSPSTAMKKLEQVSRASRKDTLLASIKDDAQAALVAIYLKPQQTIEQIFREFGLDRRLEYLRSVRVNQLAGNEPIKCDGAERDLYDAMVQLDRALLHVEYEGNRASHGGGSSRMKDLTNAVKTAGENLHRVLAGILKGEYAEIAAAAERQSGRPGRITAETMKNRHKLKD